MLAGRGREEEGRCRAIGNLGGGRGGAPQERLIQLFPFRPASVVSVCPSLIWSRFCSSIAIEEEKEKKLGKVTLSWPNRWRTSTRTSTSTATAAVVEAPDSVRRTFTPWRQSRFSSSTPGDEASEDLCVCVGVCASVCVCARVWRV